MDGFVHGQLGLEVVTCGQEFFGSLVPKNHRQAHRFARARASASTSAHGRTASGFATLSASRRSSSARSPFLAVPEAEWVCANDLCFAIEDPFPVSPGHVLVIPRYVGDMADPRGGVRHVIPKKGNYLVAQEAPGGCRGTPGAKATYPSMQTRDRPTAGSPSDSASALLGTSLSLTTGPDRPLWPRLAERLPGASEIDLLASFVQMSGLDLVQQTLFRAIAAGARVRLLVGDYLGITSPDALRQLLAWMEMAADGGRTPGLNHQPIINALRAPSRRSTSFPPRPPPPATSPTSRSTTSPRQPASGGRGACRRRSAGRRCRAFRSSPACSWRG